MYDLTLICPLYNAEKYINDLYNRINLQKNVNIDLKFILTESSDNSINILKELNLDYVLIKKEDFSHSLIREKYIMESKNKYVILISQDIILEDNETFYKMCDYLNKNNIAGAYVRQVGYIKGLDKYFREITYSKKSHIYSKLELDSIGLEASYFSDVCSIYDKDIFVKINGYDNKNLNTNEDMYYANKCLRLGLNIGYLADTYVLHSHNYKLKEIKRRYIEIGRFMYLNPNISKLKSRKSKYIKVFFISIKNLDIISMIKFPFNVLARILGQRKGYKLEKKKDKIKKVEC